MKLLLHVTPLLVLNLGGYVIIKLVAGEPLQNHLLIQLGLIALLGVVYASMMLAWLWLGRRYQLSYIYPILGLNYVIAVFVGSLAFHEPFYWQSLAGTLVIMAGVVLISTSPHSAEPSHPS